jgi:hypothetical protein
MKQGEMEMTETKRKFARPISFEAWRRGVMRRHPNATINAVIEENGWEIEAEAVVDQSVVATWALVGSYEASDQAKRMGSSFPTPPTEI